MHSAHRGSTVNLRAPLGRKGRMLVVCLLFMLFAPRPAGRVDALLGVPGASTWIVTALYACIAFSCLRLIARHRRTCAAFVGNNLAWCLLAAYGFLGIVWAVDAAFAFRGWVQLYGGLLVVVAAYALPSGTMALRRGLLLYISAFFVVSVAVLLGFPEFSWKGGAAVGINGSTSTFGTMCGVLILMAPFALRGIRHGLIYRVLLWAGLAVLLYLSHSRSSQSALVIGLSTVAVNLLGAQGRTEGRRGRGMAALFLGCLLLGVVGAAVSLIGVDPLHEIEATPSATSVTSRWSLWHASMQHGGARFFWFGHGLRGLTPEALQKTRGLPLDQPPPYEGLGGFLEVFLEQGLIGLVLLGAFFLAVGRHAQRAAARSRSAVWLRAAWVYMVVANVFQSCYGSPFSLILIAGLTCIRASEDFVSEADVHLPKKKRSRHEAHPRLQPAPQGGLTPPTVPETTNTPPENHPEVPNPISS